MAYRLIELHVAAGDDSSLTNLTFDRIATLTQTKDLEQASPTIRIAPADSDTQIALGTIATAYGLVLLADYPVKVRLNGVSATQLTLTSNNVPATNVGAPLPANCCLIVTAQVTSLYVAPITNAAQTANVWIMASGDPLSAYV